MPRRMARRTLLLLAAAALPLALWALLPLVSSGEPSLNHVNGQISHKREQIQWRKGREHVLASDVAGYTHRINGLQGDITRLEGKQMKLQASLDAKRAELAAIQEDLRRERLRLARLRARLAEARTALAARLVPLYKADKPDALTVVLESNGFADLLERTEFMSRVSRQDARIIGIVRRAKADAPRSAKRLAKLEKKAKAIADQIEGERDQVAAVKGQLVERRTRYATARAQKQEMLATTR